jgi:hypothetical protein
MSGSGMRRMAVAAVIAALGTLASAADLSPPSPTRHRPNGSLGHLPPPPVTGSAGAIDARAVVEDRLRAMEVTRRG